MKKSGGLIGENAGSCLHLVIERGAGEKGETRADCAAFEVVGAVNKAGDAGLDDRSRTHATRLDGDVQTCVSKTIVFEKAGGLSDHDDFCVRARIAVANGAVAGAREDFAVMDEDSSDGHFAGFGGGAGFLERKLHEDKVLAHVRSHVERENSMRKVRRNNKARFAKRVA